MKQTGKIDLSIEAFKVSKEFFDLYFVWNKPEENEDIKGQYVVELAGGLRLCYITNYQIAYIKSQIEDKEATDIEKKLWEHKDMKELKKFLRYENESIDYGTYLTFQDRVEQPDIKNSIKKMFFIKGVVDPAWVGFIMSMGKKKEVIEDYQKVSGINIFENIVNINKLDQKSVDNAFKELKKFVFWITKRAWDNKMTDGEIEEWFSIVFKNKKVED